MIILQDYDSILDLMQIGAFPHVSTYSSRRRINHHLEIFGGNSLAISSTKIAILSRKSSLRGFLGDRPGSVRSYRYDVYTRDDWGSLLDQNDKIFYLRWIKNGHQLNMLLPELSYFVSCSNSGIIIFMAFLLYWMLENWIGKYLINFHRFEFLNRLIDHSFRNLLVEFFDTETRSSLYSPWRVSHRPPMVYYTSTVCTVGFRLWFRLLAWFKRYYLPLLFAWFGVSVTSTTWVRSSRLSDQSSGRGRLTILY